MRSVSPTASALLLALSLSVPAVAPLAQPADTTKVSSAPLFTETDAWIAGGFVLGTILMFPLDKHLAGKLQDSTIQANRFFRNSADAVRIVTESAWYIGGGLYLVGRLAGNNEMADLGLHGSEAVAIGLGLVTIGKAAAGRARPRVDVTDPGHFVMGKGWKNEEYRSFPSGHTVMAFSAAAAVTSETSRFWPKQKYLIGTIMYGGAALTGASRMFHNAHWASDVLMGAAIGTFSGLKVVRYHHSHPGNRIDEWLLGVQVIPMPDGSLALGYRIVR